MADGLFKGLGKIFIEHLQERKRSRVFDILGTGATTGHYGEIVREIAGETVRLQDLIPVIECCCSRLIEESVFHRPLAERVMKCIKEWNYETNIKELKKAIRRDPTDEAGLHILAFLYSSCPEDKFRNGEEAVKLARKACKLNDYQCHLSLAVLAAAYAECGDFDKAIEYQKKAIEYEKKVIESEELCSEGYKELLRTYKSEKPCRKDWVDFCWE